MGASTWASSTIDELCCPLLGGGTGSINENLGHQPIPIQDTDISVSSMTNVSHHPLTGGGGGGVANVEGN